MTDLTPIITVLRLPATNDGQAWTVTDIAEHAGRLRKYADRMERLYHDEAVAHKVAANRAWQMGVQNQALTDELRTAYARIAELAQRVRDLEENDDLA